MTGEPRPSVRRPPAAERGSAYLFALLALLVLTVVGLALSAAIVVQAVPVGRLSARLAALGYRPAVSPRR